MQEYRLYLFEGDRRLPGIEITCADDERAKILALERAAGGRGELWRASVFLASWLAAPGL